MLIDLLCRDEVARLEFNKQSLMLSVLGMGLKNPSNLRDEKHRALITLKGLSNPLSEGYVMLNNLRLIKCLPRLHRKQKYGLEKLDDVLGKNVEEIQSIVNKKRTEKGLEEKKVSWWLHETGNRPIRRLYRPRNSVRTTNQYSVLANPGDTIQLIVRKLERYVSTMEEITSWISEVIELCNKGDFSFSIINGFECSKRIKSVLWTILDPMAEHYVVDKSDTINQK